MTYAGRSGGGGGGGAGDAVNWVLDDLDRCEHGRHSIDTCASCPGGVSAGNAYLDPTTFPRFMETRGTYERRIGTTVGGRAIYVTPNRRVRPQVGDEPCG